MPINPESLQPQEIESTRMRVLDTAAANAISILTAQIAPETRDMHTASPNTPSPFFQPVAEARPAVISITEAQQRVAAVHDSNVLSDSSIAPITAVTLPQQEAMGIDTAAYQRAEQARQSAQMAANAQPTKTFAEILAEAQAHAA